MQVQVRMGSARFSVSWASLFWFLKKHVRYVDCILEKPEIVCWAGQWSSSSSPEASSYLTCLCLFISLWLWMVCEAPYILPQLKPVYCGRERVFVADPLQGALLALGILAVLLSPPEQYCKNDLFCHKGNGKGNGLPAPSCCWCSILKVGLYRAEQRLMCSRTEHSL